MKSFRFIRLLAGLFATVWTAGVVTAQTATQTTPSSTYSAAGGSVTFNVSIQYTGVSLANLGFNVALPPGWSFASQAGTNPPSIPPGDGATLAAEFAYITAPANSAVFSFVLNYTAGLTGNQTITPTLLYKVTGAPSQVSVVLPSNVLAPVLSAVQSVPSKALTATTAAVSFTPVTAVNGAGPYAYAVAPPLPATLALNTTTGAITGTPGAASAATTYTVTITDSTTATANNTFSLTVNPALSSTLAVATKSLTINTAAVPFTPVTRTGGTTAFGFSVNPALPTGLSLNTADGSVSGTPTVTAAAANYTVTITDAAGATTNKAFSLTVNAAPVATQSVASKTLTAGTAAVAFTPVTGSSGTTPYVYSVSPPLPANLALNATTGAVTGTPLAASAAATYTVTITDSAGATANNTFSLTVNGGVVATKDIASKGLTAGIAAVAFTPVSATGGTPAYVYSVVPPLPSALAIDPATGAITGTPAAASGPTIYTITATDSVGASGNNTFSLTVNAALTSTLAVANKSLTINTAAVAFTPVTRSGGTSAFVFSVNPALPAGLSLNTADGSVTGTPTVEAATAAYTVTITDAAGASTNKAFNLTVNPALVATQAVASRTFTASTAIVAFTPVTGTGGTTSYVFSILPALPSGLTLSASTGSVTGTPAAASALTTYTVTITDGAGAAANQTFTIEVNGPVSATKSVASKVLTAGTAAVSFTPVTAAGGTGPYTYAVNPALPANLALSPTTGAITGTPAAASAVTTYTVTVTDSASGTANNTFTLTVNAALVANQAIASRSLTAGTAAVSFTPVTGSLGTPPYTYAVNPALPTNLALSATTGAVTGTSAASSVATSYTVTLTDSVGATSSNTFSLTVNVALAANAGAILNRPMTASAAATPFTPLPLTGGTPPYSWSVAPALPSGLTLSASTGVVSGTPAAALASANFTITGADSVGAQVTQVLTLVISPALTTTQAVASRTLSAGTAATTFTPVTAANGTGPYSFAISPALPANLTLDGATGAISGTPSAALVATTFTVTVTDSVGATSIKTFSLTVNGPLVANQAIAAKSLTATTAAVAFAPVTGAGGTAPYTYAVAPALPASLAMSTTTGSITGTAAAALAATTFTVTVTDSVAATANNTFSLTVNPALATAQAIPTKTLTAGTAAVAFTPVTASDGTPAYTYAIAPALPAALAFSTTTGAVSGTPNAALAATTYTVTVTDTVGATSNKTFSLTVNGPPAAGVTISTRTLTAGTAAVSFTPLAVTGGTPPFTFSVNPALPSGLNLSASTGAITGTAAAAAASAIYTVTATDTVGALVNQPLTLLVNAAPVATPTVPAAVLLINVAATPFTPVTVTGGTVPFVFTVNPALAAGLSMASATGTISGTPTVESGVVTHTVTATDSLGASSSASFTLKINRAPAITTAPVANPFYLVGDTLTLNVVASGSPAPTFVWRKGGTPIAGNASATTATLVIPGLQLTDAGAYDVVATNEVTSATSVPTNVIVYLPPAITTHPVSQTISAGGDATFTVVATGDPAPTFQWRRNGAPLSGATSATLSLTGVPLNGGGAIDVVATNPGGFATSNAATLTVNPLAPVFAAGLATTATAVQGREFSFSVSINNTTAVFSATGLGGPGGTLAVNPDNGGLSGVPANLGTFSIVITATNATGNASHTLSLTVQAPPPVITSATSASGRVGTAFSFTVVGTNTPTDYAATGLPPGLGINATSGVISGTPTAAGTFTVGLTVTNGGGSINQPLVIVIEPPLNAPVYSGPLNPSGTQGVVFSFTPAFGTVTAPYALTGTLPTGLTFTAATGIIAGTPTQVGTFPVTLSATNAGGTTAVALTIVINSAPSAPVITSASTAPAARVGTAFTFTLTSIGTPAASSYSATGLPAGLTLTPATGAIAGTPTVFGSFEVSVSATNTVGTGPTSILLISVAPSASAPVLTSAPVAPGQVGQLFSYTLTGSNTPTSFQITSGTLPAGLLLNATTGAITGTPLAAALGETRVWFNATSGTGPTAVSGLSLEVLFTIAPPASTPIINSNGAATAQVGQPFQYAITASSGTAITGYGATGRPAWLALDAVTGIMSGIPTEATAAPISIGLTASNGGGTGSVKILLLTVLPAPSTPVITSALSAIGRVGTALTYQVTASESPSSYVAIGLPPGLSLNSGTGLISGTPAESRSFDVVLRAANVGGLGAPSTLVVEITPAPAAPAITSDASVRAQVGNAFTYQIVATNGPILSYGLAGSLPLGLALNTSTGVIAGIPADDPRRYAVRLTATNAGGTSHPQVLLINLIPALGVPVVTTPLFASGQVGVAFSFPITATNLTGTPPYAPPILLEAVNLPRGLAVNPATGVIQGVPTAVGVTVASLTATNAAGTSNVRDLTITIRPAAAAPVVRAGSAVGQVGQAFSYQIVATNSPTSYETVGAPAWMTLSGATGLITGIPTAPGEFTLQLLASNSAGSSGPATLALSVRPAASTPVVTSTRSHLGVVGSAMSFTVVVTPALPAPTFVATGLPRGLAMNPTTGVVSGTPTVSGLFRPTITPSNSSGVGTPVTFTILVLPNRIFGN